MLIVLIALAGAALGAWKLYSLWRAVPRRNADLVLF